MSIYHMSAQIIARILCCKRDKKTGKEIFNEDIRNRENKTILKIGYEEWLKTYNESKTSFIRKLNKNIHPMEPITNLAMEY